MKNIEIGLLIGILICCTKNVLAQEAVTTIPNQQAINILKKVDAKKTLTTLELLGRLYQISLNDLTADDKSINFKSTLFGIHQVFSPDVTKSSNYKALGFERHIEPYFKFAYQNNFKTINTTIGTNFSLINANDQTSNWLLNNNPQLMRDISQFDNKLIIYTSKLAPILSSGSYQQKVIAKKHMEELEAFVRNGKSEKLSGELKKELQETMIGTETLYDAIIALNDHIDAVVRNVGNKWNVVISPQLTYAFNYKKIQGYSITANALKGLGIFKKQSTQLKIKSAFIAGSDTIVTQIATTHKMIIGELGLNQVLFMKQLKNDSGEMEDRPAGELAISGGYNYVFKGLIDNEKKGQPTLTAKLGFLVGKESWLVFPFSYNFETSKGLASISIKINLGESPIKK